MSDCYVVLRGRGETGQRRQGYMGHLTRIANRLVNSSNIDGVTDAAVTADALVLGNLINLCLSTDSHSNIASFLLTFLYTSESHFTDWV